MAKRIILTLLQFVAFLALMFVGGNWDAINLSMEMRQLQAHQTPHVLIPTIKTAIGASHILIANGVIYAAALLVLILLFEALRKRLRPWAGYSFLAFVLAVVIGFAAKMGLPPSS